MRNTRRWATWVQPCRPSHPSLNLSSVELRQSVFGPQPISTLGRAPPRASLAPAGVTHPSTTSHDRPGSSVILVKVNLNHVGAESRSHPEKSPSAPRGFISQKKPPPRQKGQIVSDCNGHSHARQGLSRTKQKNGEASSGERLKASQGHERESSDFIVSISSCLMLSSLGTRRRRGCGASPWPCDFKCCYA